MKTALTLLTLLWVLPLAMASDGPPPAKPSPKAGGRGAAPAPDPRGERSGMDDIERRFVRGFLTRHPVVSTYLGGAGLDPALAKADGTLRDWSPAALADEARFLRGIQAELLALSPALTPARRIDRDVALHQIAFMLRQDEERKYGQRALDTYVNEAFRGVDWYTQGMSDQGQGRFGAEAEWRTVAARVAALPAYLRTARTNLEAGVRTGNTPDWRMVERDGLLTSEENAKYFESVLPDLARERTKGQGFGEAVLTDLREKGRAAAAAFREFRAFLQASLASLPRTDRYALGEAEYDWALKNNLNVPFTAKELFESSWPVVQGTQRKLMDAARRVAGKRELAWDEKDPQASTRRVMDALGEDHPKSDAEMVDWYHQAALRLVDFARGNDMFDIPAEYKLDVTVTPPVLESSIDGAAYYPAPPFRDSGVGRFYVTPTKGDPEKLKEANRAAIADLSAHEGFPGHDWHYKVMTRFRDRISPVRWLTPGEVEGSSSMWEDSMAAEGWALYTEYLMSEPTAKDPQGFYTPEELIYQLQGQLYRDLRVRVDTGLHTGRLSFDDAVDLFSEVVDFQPGSCRDASASPSKRASCDGAQRAIFRYSKWPTQAITYALGKRRILDLRGRADAIMPGPAGRKRFHLLFMQQGTIPPGYFEDVLLQEMKR